MKCALAGLGFGTPTGEREEHLVEAGLAECELGDLDAGPRQLGQRGCDAVGVVDPRGQRRRVGGEVHVDVEGDRERPFGFRTVRRIAKAHLERTGADLRFQLTRGALRDEPAVIDHADAVGELVRLVEVLGRQQHRRAGAHQRPDDLPHLVTAAGIQPGRRLIEEDQRRGDHEARRESIRRRIPPE